MFKPMAKNGTITDLVLSPLLYFPTILTFQPTFILNVIAIDPEPVWQKLNKELGFLIRPWCNQDASHLDALNFGLMPC